MLYEFTRLRLERCEFDNLVFMNAPGSWKAEPKKNRFLLSICRLTLKEVVEKVIEESTFKGDNPTKVFNNIDNERSSWFEPHANISLSFDKSRMGNLWIRNLSSYSNPQGKGERQDCPNGSFYVDDGNHRALVYAMYVRLGKMEYTPVDAIHATSWDIATGILDFRPERAASLEYNGELQDTKSLRKEFQLPIGIQVKTYKRD